MATTREEEPLLKVSSPEALRTSIDSSISPIIGELTKDLETISLLEDPLSDADPIVLNLCKTLESALRHGLLRSTGDVSDFFDVVLALYDQQNTLGRPKGCMNALPVLICRSVSFVCGVKCLHSSKGRGRLLIRCGLKGNWWISLLDCLQNWSDINGHYSDDSVLRSSALFKTLLARLPSFQLDLDNFAFLDSTWERPVYEQLDLVPCKDLGLMVCSVEGHIFVTKVKPFSVAGEDDKVEVGDVIISIDNVLVFDISPEFIAKMIKKLGGRVPISLAIAKARRRTKFAEVYPSFVPYLRYCGLEIDNLQKKWVQQDKWNRWRPGRAYSCPTQEALNELKEEKNGGDERESTSSRSTCSTGAEEVFGQQQPQPRDLLMAQSGYPLCYLGSLPVGKVGDTSFLDWAIRKVMKDPGKTEHSVSLHLLELGIKLYCRTTAELVLTYPYPKISAAGCNSTDARYVAFIGGDDLCRLAKNFLCHVFYAEDARIAREIVHHMANGFERTLTTA